MCYRLFDFNIRHVQTFPHRVARVIFGDGKRAYFLLRADGWTFNTSVYAR